MPKLCLAKTKYNKQFGSNEVKEAISDAENVIENNIKEFFKAASTVLLNEKNQNFLKNLKQKSKEVKLNCILIIFSAKGFKEIGTSDVFKLNDDSNFVYPEAVCVITNCLSSLNYTSDEIEEVLNQLTIIKYMWDMTTAGYKIQGKLPLYNLHVSNAEKHSLYKINNNDIIDQLVSYGSV